MAPRKAINTTVTLMKQDTALSFVAGITAGFVLMAVGFACGWMLRA